VAGEAKIPATIKFLENYEEAVLQALEPVRLVMVVFSMENSVLETKVRTGVEGLENNYPGFSFTVSVLKNQTFNRAVGLMAGIAETQPSDLLLLLDVDIQFSTQALDSVRHFTKRGQQAYFPIVFSQFKDADTTLSSRTGYWRDFGFGIMSAFSSDLQSVGGLNTGINGWGKEDVDLYDRFLKSDTLSVFRAASPEFVHRYHPVTCSQELAQDQANMCNSSRANTYLSQEELVGIVLNSSMLHG